MQLVEILQSNLNEFDIISFFFIKPNCVCIIKVNFQGSFYCIIEFLCNLNIQYSVRLYLCILHTHRLFLFGDNVQGILHKMATTQPPCQVSKYTFAERREKGLGG